MEKILITGSSGFLGSRLLKTYNNNFDYEVMGFYTKNMDITDANCITDIFNTYHPNYVIHCAAVADQCYAQEHEKEAYAINVEGAVNIAKQCKKGNIKLVYMSSDQVYNGCLKEEKLLETEAVMPENVYAAQKLEAEKQISAILPNAVGLRLTWLYDLPNRYIKTNSNLLWNIIRANLSNTPLSFSAREYRGITYVWDLIGNMDKILRLPGGVYNCGSMNDNNTYETALYAAEHLGIPETGKTILCDRQRYPEHIRNLAMNTEKIKEHGISFYDTLTGINRCLKEYGIYLS